MNPAEWARLKEWFGQAIEADSDRRGRILAQAADEDPTLAAELLSLLREHEAPDFGTQDVCVPLSSPAIEAHPDGLPAGVRIGPYRLIRELGRGGTGLVFLAERQDDEFHRQVALKILRYLPRDSRAREALTSERRALVRMQHPNIALLLDWGTTDAGAPWLATEYIAGVALDQFCQQRQLGLDARIELLSRVGEAVQYAHRHLVVHRDLKPANILVSHDGIPKLLDFGIAQPSDHAAANEQRFTPSYASPEQIRADAITAASDVYSLGLILYELLAGQLPAQRAPAPPPSTTPGLARRSARRLGGDLDRILLRCLEADPELRYASVEQFLADLERYRTHFPIAASRPLHRCRKFLRRNGLAVSLTAIAALALIAGTAAAVWNASRARHQENLAEQRFDDVKNLAHWVIFEGHDSIRKVPGTAEVRAQLLSRALEYLDRLSSAHAQNDALALEIAQAYLRIGYDEGGITGTNLGNTAVSIRSYRQALALLQGLAARHPGDASIATARFAAAYNLGPMLPDPAAGFAFTQPFAAQADAWAQRQSVAFAFQAQGLLHTALGRLLTARGDPAAALSEFDRAAAAQSRAAPLTHDDRSGEPMFQSSLGRSQADFDRGLTEIARARAWLALDRAPAALASARQAQQWFARAAAEAAPGPSDQRMFVRIHGMLAECQAAQHPPQLVQAWAESQIELPAARAATTDGTATALRDLAEAEQHRGAILGARGQLRAALPPLQAAVRAARQLVATDPLLPLNRLLLASFLNDQAELQLRLRQPAAARPVAAEAAAVAARGLATAPSSFPLRRQRDRARASLAKVSGPF